MIVSEDRHFWVLNKPNGEVINDDHLHSGIISKFQDEIGARAYPVHRLDKATSGLLLVAKTKEANQALSRAFQEKKVSKHYLAICKCKQGARPKKKQGWIKGDMAKVRNGSWKLLQSKLNPAVTYFQSTSLGDHQRLCLVKPISGKTHQIRVAMRSLSMPILGDTRYGGEESDRMYLHAMKLEFELFGETYSYELWPDSGAVFSLVEPSVMEKFS